VLTLYDFLAVFKKNRSKIAITAAVFALLGFFIQATKPVEYIAEGTFLEKNKASNDTGSLIKLFGKETDDSSGISLMKSRKLAMRLALANNMQATIAKDQSDPFALLRVIKNNLLAEYAIFRPSQAPSVTDPKEEIAVTEIKFTGETPLNLSLIADSDKTFSLYDENNKKMGEGAFGTPFTDPKVTLTAHMLSDSAAPGERYLLHLQPLAHVAKGISLKLKIDNDAKDRKLLKITYTHPNRHLAAKYINDFMQLYIELIREEMEELKTIQVGYLNKRHYELTSELEKVLTAHAHAVSSDLKLTGFTSSSEAFRFIAKNQKKLQEELIALNMNIHRLAQVYEFSDYEKVLFFPSTKEIHPRIHEVTLLRQEANALKLGLKNEKTDPNSHLVSEGINRQTAHELLLGYSKEFSKNESTLIQQQFIIQQLQDPEFEISSLSSTINDEIAASIMSKTSQLVLSLKDNDNLSLKEKERIKSDLKIQKQFLINHLQQNSDLVVLSQEHLKDKINMLKHKNLLLINDHISILEREIKEFIGHALENMKDEARLIQKNLSDLQFDMSLFPSKWTEEQLIEYKMNVNYKIMEELVQLVETKLSSANLEVIRSSPVDQPIVPLHPKPHHLLLFTLLGAFFGGFISCGWALFQSVVNGVHITKEGLIANGQHVSGLLSRQNLHSSGQEPLHNSDLETLRHLLTFMEGNKTNGQQLLALENHGPHYAPVLAELLFKSNKTAILLDLNFDRSDSQANGLLQYLEGKNEAPAINKTLCYDYIEAGGICRYGNELSGTKRFTELLTKLQKMYDWTILYTNVSPGTAEAKNLLQIFPLAAITVINETLSDLEACVADPAGVECKRTFLIVNPEKQ